MDRTLLKKAKVYKRKHRRKSTLRKMVRFLGCLVVFCTTYALILPAITQEKPLFCGMEVHIHEEACYEQTQPAAQKELLCGMEEAQAHLHGEDCYAAGENLLCAMEENHVHGDDCFAEAALVCTVSAHAHGGDCYGRGALICADEDAAHTHGDGCYQENPIPGRRL